jgi:hypothetical protein
VNAASQHDRMNPLLATLATRPAGLLQRTVVTNRWPAMDRK